MKVLEKSLDFYVMQRARMRKIKVNKNGGDNRIEPRSLIQKQLLLQLIKD